VTALPTLAAALEWASKHWDGRNPPYTLNVHDTEGELGGLAYSKAFIGYLSATPNQTTEETVTAPCQHWARKLPALCPVCGVRDRDGKVIAETNVYSKTVLRYRWPMWRAITKLQNALRPRNEPHPYALILVLARYGWQPRSAARELGLPWDYAEASFLRAIRQLHGRYEEAPVDTRRSTSHAAAWTELSVSQQNAIIGGETAA
jgi:hypothetical protein